MNDNTAVIRMKRDFDKFISGQSGRLDLSQSVGSDDSSFMNITSGTALSVKSMLEKEKDSMLKDAELSAARGTIAKLEAEISTLKTSNKRARIEFEKDLGCIKEGKDRESDKMKELKSQIHFLSSREKYAREELEEYKKVKDNSRSDYETKIIELKKGNMKLQDEVQKTRQTLSEKTTEFRSELLKSQTSLQKNINDLEESQIQLKLQQRRVSELMTEISELEEHRTRASTLEQQLKELETKCTRMEEDAIVTKAMKSQLTLFPDIEKEVKKLREQNAQLREIQENNVLLKEKAESLERKLERAEKIYTDAAHLDTENLALKSKLQKWEQVEKDGRSPSQLAKRLTCLQESEAVMLERQGQLQSRIHSLEEHLNSTQQKLETTITELQKEKSKVEQNADLIKRLQRKLLFVTKERDGFKNILDSYESEMTVNVAKHASSRIQHLEETIENYRKQVDQLEGDLQKAFSQNGAQRMDNPQTYVPVVPAQSEVDKKTILQLRERISVLEKELEKSEEQRYILETRIEQRHLQGDYDPTKTKVIHFEMNPVAMAAKQRAAELQRLREENETLKERIRVLEESGGQAMDVTEQVQKRLSEPSCSKEVDEIKAQLTKEELKNKRLMEAFSKKSQEFREVCYQLTGYKIDFHYTNQYKVTSMYAESRDDFFIFQQGEKNDMQLLSTDFTENLEESIDLYLSKHKSIPAFLSSVTLDLFKTQTFKV